MRFTEQGEVSGGGGVNPAKGGAYSGVVRGHRRRTLLAVVLGAIIVLALVGALAWSAWHHAWNEEQAELDRIGTPPSAVGTGYDQRGGSPTCVDQCPVVSRYFAVRGTLADLESRWSAFLVRRGYTVTAGHRCYRVGTATLQCTVEGRRTGWTLAANLEVAGTATTPIGSPVADVDPGSPIRTASLVVSRNG